MFPPEFWKHLRTNLIFIAKHEIKRCDKCGKNFNAKKDLRMHKNEHKRKNKPGRNGEEDNLADLIEGAEFIFDELRELENDTLALL